MRNLQTLEIKLLLKTAAIAFLASKYARTQQKTSRKKAASIEKVNHYNRD